MLDFIIVQLLQIKEPLQEGRNTQVDHLAFKMVQIELILSNANSSDELNV